MKDLQKYLSRYINYYQSRCDHFETPDICKRTDGCACKAVAEVWAYTKAIVPEEYVDLTIHNFEGVSNVSSDIQSQLKGEEIRTLDQLAFAAKLKIWNYCWGSSTYSADMTQTQMDQISVIAKRFKEGTNVVIHGTHYRENFDQQTNRPRRVPMRKGKSLLGSIVLKEAIRRKMFADYNASTFDYVSYPILRPALIDRQDQNKREMASDLEERDWLLIDDITIDEDRTERGDFKRYMKSQIDSFLMSRLDAGKPTIFILQFNLNDYDIRSELGYVMEKIVTTKSNCIVQV